MINPLGLGEVLLFVILGLFVKKLKKKVKFIERE